MGDPNEKRAGRPKGAKSSSPVLRDLMRAYRSLEKPDAKPLPPRARMWLDYARTNPSDFLGYVFQADRETRAREEDRKPESYVLSVPRRVKTLFVPREHLEFFLTGNRAPWVRNLPHCFQCVSACVDPSRQGVVLTLESGAFPLVAAGEPIPEFNADFTSAPR